MAKSYLVAAMLCFAFLLAGCAAGDDSGGGDSSTTTSTGGFGVGGNTTIGNSTVSGGINGTTTTTGAPGNGTNATAPMSASVSIEHMQFVNQTVTVRVGGTVTWTHNDGSTPHTVTADDGSFDSSPGCAPTVPPLPPSGDCMTQGDTFSATFTAPGDVAYHDKLNTGMTGTVHVVA